MSELVEINKVRLECKKCSTVRVFNLDPPLRTIDSFECFMESIDPCQKCGHEEAEIEVTVPVLN